MKNRIRAAARVRAMPFPWLKWTLPAAACLTVAAIGFFLLRDPAADGGLEAIRGLPASRYTWDGDSDTAMGSRLPTNELRYLMRPFSDDRKNRTPEYQTKTVFAVVRVVSAEPFTDAQARRGQTEGQIAVCDVLYDVLGDSPGDSPSDSSSYGLDAPLKVMQYRYGFLSAEQTSLIRVGGVYVLPLINSQNEAYWRIYGDEDCLFEVDDRGLIQSHAKHPKLYQYDGVPLPALWADIAYLYDHPLLFSELAERISWGYEAVRDENEIALYHTDGTRLTAADGFFSAAIGSDGRIEITGGGYGGFNVFRPVEGMTVDEMYAAIQEIKQFVGIE